MAQKRITDLPQITQITDTTKLYFGEQIKDFQGTFAQVKTALSYQQILDRLQLLEDNLIGSIQTFASLDLTEDYLLCDGAEYLKSDYPKLYSKIGDVFGSGDYPEPTDADHFRVPNLLDMFIRNTDGSRDLGTKQTDTMRKIVGSTLLRYDVIPNPESPKGAFAKSRDNVGGYVPVQLLTNNANGPDTFSFDSSKGIEGQEGQISPNVGDETAPKNITLIFAIKAK